MKAKGITTQHRYPNDMVDPTLSQSGNSFLLDPVNKAVHDIPMPTKRMSHFQSDSHTCLHCECIEMQNAFTVASYRPGQA